jgi:hypothetical protein
MSHTIDQKYRYWRARAARKINSQLVSLNAEYQDIISIARHMGISEEKIGFAARQIDSGWNGLLKLILEEPIKKDGQAPETPHAQ